ncbi:MAG: gliding motility-associated ABC transporter ATP-binding subunit GldA, partial [Bacteroidetes bacterium]|nr:gliding motility-associated ABC transporter ATP-binding subunit GldA [Bacteroidota bacterium]
YRIACDNAEQVKKQLLQWSIENKVDVLSLQTIEQSLESIFRSFTQ